MQLDFDRLPRFREYAMKVMMLVPQWARAHGVSEEAIVRQVYLAHAWADSNPKKAPKKYIPRYLFSWMNQAKRYGNLRIPEKPKPLPVDVEPDLTEEDMREMHLQTLKIIKVCRSQDCRFCVKS